MTQNKVSKLHALAGFGRLWATLCLLSCIGWASAQSTADLVPVPPLTGRVVDLTNTFKPDQKSMLEQQLRDFESRKGSQLAVLLVPGTQPETIEQYALRVAEQWKIGRKKIDDGAILVIAKNERALRIEVGYGLEGALNDATAKRIVEERIVPRFKEGDFYGGTVAGVDAMVRVIEGEPLPAPSVAVDLPGGMALLPVLFFAAVIVGGIARALLGRVKGALLAGGLLGMAGWWLAGAAIVGVLAAVAGFVLTLAGGRMGSGWHGGAGHYGGYGGSSGGWGGSGGGGFRGGGGGFGGGGASGRW